MIEGKKKTAFSSYLTRVQLVIAKTHCNIYDGILCNILVLFCNFFFSIT